jgi:hypothetical protein
MTKFSRVGLTRKEWVDFIVQSLASVGHNVLPVQIEFNADGIDIQNWATIGFGEEERVTKSIVGDHKHLVRGYTLTVWESHYSYSDGYDTWDREIGGVFDNPMQVVMALAQELLKQNMQNIYEGLTTERDQIKEAKYEEELEQYYNDQEKELTTA